VDADVFFSYLTADNLVSHSESVVLAARQGALNLYVCSEIYDDLISALRSGGASLEAVMTFLSSMQEIPHTPLSITAQLAHDALAIYNTYGGSRRLHYFDAFHVAASRIYHLPLITSDDFVITHGADLQVAIINLRTV
jgi:uncharacterized protein with PIN domain